MIVRAYMFTQGFALAYAITLPEIKVDGTISITSIFTAIIVIGGMFVGGVRVYDRLNAVTDSCEETKELCRRIQKTQTSMSEAIIRLVAVQEGMETRLGLLERKS